MGRCADVLQAAQSLATCAVGIGAPYEELIKAALPAVWVAADKVDVHAFQFGRRIGCARQLYLGEILDMA